MSERTGLEIAVVGMAGRFPRAATLEELWRRLAAGEECIRRYSRGELLAAGVRPEMVDNPAYVPAAGALDDPEHFDAPFFAINPREAEILDPQHRLLLECAWEALETAGYDAAQLKGAPVGVFAGCGANSYFLTHALGNRHLLAAMGGLHTGFGVDKDHLAPLVAYKLGLEGPSVSVQTACSTALVATHLACQALLNGECDLALAGGSSVQFPAGTGYMASGEGFYSRDGHCRAFDADADGTVPSSGVGCVVLKRLDDALDHRDTVLAVIKGSAVNNDGALRAGYTAPRADGQAKVVRAAHLLAEVDPATIALVEAHGSATALGDPIEVSALAKAFRAGTGERGYCALGSVKSNLGHTGAASGMAGLFKAVLALGHRRIPPTLHFRRPNPGLDLEASPFYVNTEAVDFPAVGGAPRRAGVNSFGLGGTNVHVVLEEAPPPPAAGEAREAQLVVLSAATEEALAAAAGRLGRHLAEHPEAELADVAFTLAAGRRSLSHRRARVCRGWEEARQALEEGGKGWLTSVEAERPRPVAFLFPGLGVQVAGLGAGLYAAEPAFRRAVDEACELMGPELGGEVREILTAEAAAPGGGGMARLVNRGGEGGGVAAPLGMRLAHPALFIAEIALARLWRSWGVEPEALLGYSLGEYVAACLAGVLSLEDALSLVAGRARLLEALPTGGMVAVPRSPQALEPLLGGGLSVAAVNGPEVTVVAGPEAAVAELIGALEAEGEVYRRLPVGHAFHSPAMEPAAEELTGLVRGLTLNAPRIPYLSDVTGTWVTAEEATDPTYWARHLTSPVRFASALEELLSEPERCLLEVGPGQGLASLALQHPAAAGRGTVAVASLAVAAVGGEDSGDAPGAGDGEPGDGRASLLGAAAHLWLAGVRLDWGGFYAGETRRRLPLPTYPFQRRRYSLAPSDGAAAEAAATGAAPPTDVEPAAAQLATHERPPLRTAFREPAPGLEQRLAGLWRDLLGVHPVGADDNFFELGGHSLAGMRLITRLRGELGAEIPLRELFAAPTVAELATRLEGLTDESRGAGAFEPVPAGEATPLSFSQQRLWFLDQLAPGTPFYNISAALRLAGRLSVAAFQRAMAEIVRRHETLRSRFVARGGEAVVEVAPATGFPVPVVDLSRVEDEAVRTATVRRLAARGTQAPFDLERGGLVRALLLRLGSDEHAVVVTMHHIISDGWSMGVFVRELVALYEAFARGEASPLPELPVQYGAYAAWQRRHLAGARLEAEVEHWRRQLAGLPPVLDLPTDRPRPPVQGYRGAHLPFALPPDLTAAVHALGRERGATPFMTLLAAFAALLGRLSGQADLAVGTPVANRTRPEIEGLIGFFVNTLVLRVRPRPRLSFGELLEAVREAALDAFQHQELPFEKLVEELAPERSLAHAPLFQVLLVLQNAPMEPVRLPGLVLSPLEAETGTSRFDLALSLAEAGGALAGAFEYSTELFDRATVVRFAHHLERLLAAAVAAPEAPLGELGLLSPAQRQQLLAEWNDTAVIPAAGAVETVSRQVAAVAASAPDTVAVIAGGEHLSFGALLGRARALGAHLRGRGVGTDVPVAVLAERSPELVVASLAVMLAGGAYVPLDPGNPAERLALVLEDLAPEGEAPWVLAEERWAGRLRPLPRGAARVLTLEGGGAPAASAAGARDASPPPESLAYVVFTSGSTGRPKGAAVSHGALANMAGWYHSAYRPAVGDRAGATSSPSFDASVLELWPPLAGGAAVALVDDATRAEPALLAAWLAAHRITLTVLATPLAHAIVDVLEAAEPARRPVLSLRTLLIGGDRLLPRRWRELPFAVRNHYGPTEVTVSSTWGPVPADPAATPSIGRPLPNLRAYVADARLRPVPMGAAGELVLAGDSLARGYFRRPGLTAERFVPDPWARVAGAPGSRLYRSGDLVRFLPGGELDFLGRIDHQVKVRGFRVELGEIETALAAQPQVREAVVVAAAPPSGEAGPAVGGEARLVAYVVPEVGEDADALPATLRQALGERLPAFMVPSAFITLEAMPHTATGKVDRRALPEPEIDRAQAGVAYVPPRSPEEETLAEIWARVLGVERVGVHDSFFDLGGHSLLATQVAAQVREAFEVELPVRALFEAPTVAALAVELGRCEAAAAGAPAAGRIPRQPRQAGENRFAVSFSQLREWILDRLDPGSGAYNIPTTLSLEGELSVPALEEAAAEIARRHESLRTRFEAAPGGEPVQVVAPEADAAVAVPVVDLTALPPATGQELARHLAGREAGRPFRLSRGPLLRLTLLRRSAREHWLLLTMHHIISDGWSMGIFSRELAALYEACRHGEPSPLDPLPLQYPDFAVWQRRHLQGERMEELVGYWRRQLAGSSEVLELPTDRPRPPLRSARGGMRLFRLGAGPTAAARELARREGASLFMVLLSALAGVLSRTSGQRDLNLGTFIANRNRAETQGIIGFFINTLVLRADLTAGSDHGEPGFAEVVRRQREVTLGAYAHQDLPFERLLEHLHPQRDQSRTPLFQVLCVLQNLPIAPVELPDLTLRPVESAEPHADFDLTLWLAEAGDEVVGNLEYAADLFDGSTMARLARHLEALLVAGTARPEVPVAALPVLGAGEAHQLTVEWNDSGPAHLGDPAHPQSARPSEAPVHRLFAAQAAAAPAAVAVVGDGGERLSYGALASRVEELGSRLAARAAARAAHSSDGNGSGAEPLVALAVERTPAGLAALLAVLEAGAAYLPLDPALPAERLRFLLADSGAALLLTDAASRPAVVAPAEEAGCPLLELESLAGAEGAPPAARKPAPGPSTTAADLARLAYVIYTSGSTGEPKGVAVSHRSLAAYVATAGRQHGIGPGDRVLQFAAWSFDASAEEIYPCLTRGGTLLLRRQGLAAPAELAALAESHGLTVLDLPTAYWHSLVASRTALPASLRLVIIGGEAASAEAVAGWRQNVPRQVRLLNTYGPTEATIVAAAAELSRPGPDMPRVPMGRPVPGARAQVLDRRLAPVPLGAPGQLCLAGSGLARGYLGRSALTAERFVPHPAPGRNGLAPGARLYLTGDLARHLPSGELEFVGRTDHQVKVRGFRIELGEIEAALAAHPAVAEAVVMARRDGDGAASGATGTPAGAGGAARLVAYVVPRATAGEKGKEPTAPSVGELRSHLAARLPEYMVPALFVTLDELPLTRHGKVDRRALPAPEGVRPDLEAAYTPPKSAVERQLASLWQEVLGVEKVGVHDNFFELGGDSLLLLTLHERLQGELGVELPVLELFRFPTVESLAGRLQQQEGLTRSLEEVQSRTTRRQDLAAQRRERLRQARRPPRKPSGGGSSGGPRPRGPRRGGPEKHGPEKGRRS